MACSFLCCHFAFIEVPVDIGFLVVKPSQISSFNMEEIHKDVLNRVQNESAFDNFVI